MLRGLQTFGLAWLLAVSAMPAAAFRGELSPLQDPEAAELFTLQNPRKATTWFPQDREQRPDWVDVLKRGLINPRETLHGGPRATDPMGQAPREGILFTNTREMPYVVFPHQPHVEWLTCANCHDALFPRLATGRGKGMNAIFAGEHCGACHGRVAFSPIGSCYRCHSQPNPQGIIPMVTDAAIEAAKPAAPAEVVNTRRRRGRDDSQPLPLPGGFAPAQRR